VLHRLLALNPLTSLVAVYREVVFTGRVPSPMTWLMAFIVGVVAWWLGTMVFLRFRETVVEAV
jgi:ABC-type polysaccharide/polyol phosphate export permease